MPAPTQYTPPAAPTTPVVVHWGVNGANQGDVPIPPRVPRTSFNFNPTGIGGTAVPSPFTPANWEAWKNTHVAGIGTGAWLASIPVGYTGYISLDYESFISTIVEDVNFSRLAGWRAAGGSDANYYTAVLTTMTEVIAAVKALRPLAKVGIYNTPGNNAYTQTSATEPHPTNRAAWDVLVAGAWAPIIELQDVLLPSLYSNNTHPYATTEQWVFETLAPTGRWALDAVLGAIPRVPYLWFRNHDGISDQGSGPLDDDHVAAIMPGVAAWSANAIMWGYLITAAAAQQARASLDLSWWPRLPGAPTTGVRSRARARSVLIGR